MNSTVTESAQPPLGAIPFSTIDSVSTTWALDTCCCEGRGQKGIKRGREKREGRQRDRWKIEGREREERKRDERGWEYTERKRSTVRVSNRFDCGVLESRSSICADCNIDINVNININYTRCDAMNCIAKYGQCTDNVRTMIFL